LRRKRKLLDSSGIKRMFQLTAIPATKKNDFDINGFYWIRGVIRECIAHIFVVIPYFRVFRVIIIDLSRDLGIFENYLLLRIQCIF